MLDDSNALGPASVPGLGLGMSVTFLFLPRSECVGVCHTPPPPKLAVTTPSLLGIERNVWTTAKR